MTVEESTQRDLDAIAKRDEALAESAIAASALAMARELDNASNSATSKAMCAKALREAMDRLRELAPEVEKSDDLDELSRRRSKRLGRRTTA